MNSSQRTPNTRLSMCVKVESALFIIVQEIFFYKKRDLSFIIPGLKSLTVI